MLPPSLVSAFVTDALVRQRATLAGVLVVLCAAAAGATEGPIPLRAPDAELRQALDDGKPARVLKAVQEKAIAERIPGLHAAALAATGKQALACAVVRDDRDRSPTRAGPLSLVLARCEAEAGNKDAARKAWARFLDTDKGPQAPAHNALAQDPRVLDEATHALLTGPAFERWLDVAATAKSGWSIHLEAPSDTDKREAYARFLLAVVGNSKRTLAATTAEEKARNARIREGGDAALKRLYIEFGETTAGKAALAAKSARKLARHKDKKLAIERARLLSRRHDNRAVVDTLRKHMPKASDKSATGCELRYIVGKAQRKMRRYKSARRNLDFVANKCSGDWQKRARYMTARVASFQGAKDAVATFDAFVTAYPKDTLTDDVLLWKAEHLALRRQKPAAEKVYETLIEQHPTGDMANTARFDLALMRARRGDVAGARAALDALARNAIDSNILVADRALYWRARLLAYPQVDSWDATSDQKARAEGAQGLLALAEARPASFYGHLAKVVASTLAPKEAFALANPPSRAVLDDKMTVPVSKALATDRRFSLALELHRAGYDDTAVALLEDIDHKGLPVGDALALTALLTNAGAHAEGHQVLRDQGLAVPKGRPTTSTMALWSLSFPRAHAEAIEDAAAATKLPPEVLFGLAREESAFDAAVVSWAGAVGLTQLMMFTAKEEAQILKKPVPSVDDLRHPRLNARLGANHLMRRQKLGHPLLAIAAYNAGPGNVNKWTLRQKGPIDAWVESIPIAQTRGYVVKVTGSWVVYSLLAGIEAPFYSLSIPGMKEPKRPLKAPLKVAPNTGDKVKRSPKR